MEAHTARSGYLNEQLPLMVGRVGSDRAMPAFIDQFHVGNSLALRPSEDVSDLDDFQPNDVIRARFSRPADATYRFSSRVLDVDGRNQLLWVTVPVNIERVQARRHVRVATPLAAEVAPAGPRRLSGTTTASGYRSVRITDISAGGIAIRTDEVLEIGTVLLVEARVPDRRTAIHLTARAEVVRSALDSGPDEPTCYRYGLAYLDLASKEEAQLVSSIFWHLSQQRVSN